MELYNLYGKFCAGYQLNNDGFCDAKTGFKKNKTVLIEEFPNLSNKPGFFDC